jgi:hypothetical protein
MRPARNGVVCNCPREVLCLAHTQGLLLSTLPVSGAKGAKGAKGTKGQQCARFGGMQEEGPQLRSRI